MLVFSGVPVKGGAQYPKLDKSIPTSVEAGIRAVARWCVSALQLGSHRVGNRVAIPTERVTHAALEIRVVLVSWDKTSVGVHVAKQGITCNCVFNLVRLNIAGSKRANNCSADRGIEKVVVRRIHALLPRVKRLSGAATKCIDGIAGNRVNHCVERGAGERDGLEVATGLVDALADISDFVKRHCVEIKRFVDARELLAPHLHQGEGLGKLQR